MFFVDTKVFERIAELIEKNPSADEYFYDGLNFVRNALKENRAVGLRLANQLERQQGAAIRAGRNVVEATKRIHEILIAKARYSLDAYFLALEYNRPLRDQFYLPRRKKLKEVVEKLEKLLITDELDEMVLSLPPRVGKTSLALFVVSWLIGCDSERSNLYASCSGQLCNAFYKGVYELLIDDYTYCWAKIFPQVRFDKNSFCNAKETYIDTGRVKRYHSMTCRSIDAEGLNGACDCNGLLIGDDLCSGIEEALNPSRLVALWGKVNNNLITRAKMGAKILWIGTRWSKSDPIGLRLDMLINEPEFKNRRVALINMPALDEEGNSNFDYLYDVGFNSDYYKQRRKSFEATDDIASWLAQYQGEPVERSGLLFPPNSIKTYNGVLPEGRPDRIYAPVDVAWGGGDYTSMPIFYQYGDDVYIHGWVYDNGDKYITRPKIINAILKYKVQAVEFEKNNGGDEYKEYVERELQEKHGYRLNITARNTSTHQAKESRIFDKAPEIKEFYFLEPSKRDADYQKAMEALMSYVVLGKNKNDDGPDSLSKGCEMRRIAGLGSGISYKVLKRPF